MMKVCLITATKNRDRHLERVVRFVLNQTSSDYVHLIFNNSTIPQRLNSHLSTDKFLLVNSPVSTVTGKPYTTLGEIYNDIIRFIPADADVVNFMDDDDIYLPNHVEEGVKGMIRGGKKAYKPRKSWYKAAGAVHLVENVLEPSIFIKASHIKEHGFSNETTAQHLKWLNALVREEQIFVDDEGIPTYVCDWSQQLPTFKTSGNPHNPENFKNYSKHSIDSGDGIITPCSKAEADHYYSNIKPNASRSI